MSINGKRGRSLFWFEVNVSRSFDDWGGSDIKRQINEPVLTINLNRLSVEFHHRPHRWMWAPNARNFVQFGTPWFYGELFVEQKSDEPGPEYFRNGDWAHWHDKMVDKPWWRK